MNFQNKIVMTKLNLISILHKIKIKKHNIAGVSAPSRSTTLINYCGLNKDIIDMIFEIKGSKKIGLNIPGTSIPVVEENFSKIRNYKFLVIFSWHIKDQLISIYKKNGYKGRFIIPLPSPKII